MLPIEGGMVSVDAMGCHCEIAAAILGKRPDDIRALKGNPGTLREGVELFANDQKRLGFTDTRITPHSEATGNFGWIEPPLYHRSSRCRLVKKAP
jgi:hypothetical protein